MMTDHRFREIREQLHRWQMMDAGIIEPVEVAQQCFAECRALLAEMVDGTDYKPSWWRRLLGLP